MLLYKMTEVMPRSGGLEDQYDDFLETLNLYESLVEEYTPTQTA